MDPSMEIQSVKLPIHHHPLYPSSRFINARCGSCGVRSCIHGGYRCNDYECVHVWFHKECTESPPEINHPSHPDHPLELNHSGSTMHCDLCTKNFGHRVIYSCSTCDFNVDTGCATNLSYGPPDAVIEDPMSHIHPLVLTNEVGCTHPCEACNKRCNVMDLYSCLQCNLHFHKECVNQLVEVNHPCHPNHCLKFITSGSLPHDAERACLLCGEELVKSLYHCDICNFSICLYCWRSPPPLTIEHLKTHDHHLILLPRKVSFTCNVCGMQGDRSPYVCFSCGFMVHRECIDLPRVININRHDHPISFTAHLGSEENLECPICWQGINRYYGAYTCSIYKDYAVHSHCATRDDVWDGIELEGMPEDTEDISSFKEEGDNLVRHFLHEKHILRLNKDGLNDDESTRCEACISPLYSDPIYSCGQCDFVLHERCAKLPRKKRHMFHVRPLPLEGQKFREMFSFENWFQCQACKTLSSGFKYKTSAYFFMDVICSSFSEPFKRHDPLPPLFLSEKDDASSCVACGKVIRGIRAMRSDDGKFVLDFRCANLPKKVKHRYDEHPLSLCYGEDDASGKYWCDICERETDPKKWFYTCSDCGTTLHIDCVLGDFSNIKPGCIYKHWSYSATVIPNNRSFRPLCYNCGSRCKGPFILQVLTWSIEYICSLPCAMPFFRKSGLDFYFSVYHLV